MLLHTQGLHLLRCGFSLLRSVCYGVPAETGYMLKHDMLGQAKLYIWMFVDRPYAAAICSSHMQQQQVTAVSIYGVYAQKTCLEETQGCSKAKFHKICRGRLAMYQAMDAAFDVAESTTPAGVCGCW